MTAFATLALPNEATKLRFKEPFVSEAVNLKDAGVIPPGVYRGFTANPQAAFILKFDVSPTSNDSVAVVETTQNYNMTVRSNAQLTVDMTGQVTFPVYAVLRTSYGITPSPLTGFTFSNILIVKTVLDNGDPESLHTGDVKLCRIINFVGTTPNISIASPADREDLNGPLASQNQLVSAGTTQAITIKSDIDIGVTGGLVDVAGTIVAFTTTVAGEVLFLVSAFFVNTGALFGALNLTLKIDGIDEPNLARIYVNLAVVEGCASFFRMKNMAAGAHTVLIRADVAVDMALKATSPPLQITVIYK